MADRKNMFARADTLAKLDEMFEIVTSPENLYADGERSHSQANSMYRRYKHDYEERRAELRLDALNAERQTSQQVASIVDAARERMNRQQG